MSKYQKILLKLSGEALAGANNIGFCNETINFFVDEILKVYNKKVNIGIVVGGGNLFRGQRSFIDIDRQTGDYVGMLATVMNAIVLKNFFEKKAINAVVISATHMEPFASMYSPDLVDYYFSQNYIIIFAGGTGNPFFTTDTAAALRAIQIGAQLLIKASNVDGIYSEDPRKNPDAVKYDEISFKEAINKNLKVMDLSAFVLCMENNIPIVVYNCFKPDYLSMIIDGKNIGTIVK